MGRHGLSLGGEKEKTEERRVGHMDLSRYDEMSNSREGPEGELEVGPRGALLDWDALAAATACLKTVAHPVRLRILELLMEGEYTVGELAELCEVEQASASEHLGKLRDRRLLTQDRRGRQVYYQVAAPAVGGIVACMRKNFGPESSDGTEGCGG